MSESMKRRWEDIKTNHNSSPMNRQNKPENMCTEIFDHFDSFEDRMEFVKSIPEPFTDRSTLVWDDVFPVLGYRFKQSIHTEKTTMSVFSAIVDCILEKQIQWSNFEQAARFVIQERGATKYEGVNAGIKQVIVMLPFIQKRVEKTRCDPAKNQNEQSNVKQEAKQTSQHSSEENDSQKNRLNENSFGRDDIVSFAPPDVLIGLLKSEKSKDTSDETKKETMVEEVD